ncbi:xanthine dehydrogenase family protein subunit M [Sediminibacterium roseum]|uniref:Xanthine dehydrogenase family protein subunit M n=1 Tax=Sediminibacterium roseum TaxID=1978412 RepID=A0ABW9ZX44_9BACT|nr:xanthine dehydrogenase family protein subunit M [Sediminibacterium roseum]NCI50292.1 xanthine dehydrogenase family protein subunit M [Sediminibacterium roseum]
MNAFEYMRAATAASAVSALAKNEGAAFLAGGTNLIDLMKRGVTAPSRLIDVNSVPLAAVEKTATGIRIGALAKNSDVSEHELVVKHFPLLSMAFKAGASPQLRNMASVGGNMMQRTRCGYFYDTSMPCNKREPGSGCGAIGGYNRMHAIFGTSDQCIAVHPSDMCVALVALDATVTVTGAKGERKIPFGDFHRLPGDHPEKDNTLQKGEMITGVTIPNNNLAAHSHYLKIRDRASYAFALVSVAAALDVKNGTIQDIRLAMGGVAHKPWRLTEAEKFLKGKIASEDNFQKAATIAMTNAKGYGHNDFKLKLAPNAIVEALKKAGA